MLKFQFNLSERLISPAWHTMQWGYLWKINKKISLNNNISLTWNYSLHGQSSYLSYWTMKVNLYQSVDRLESASVFLEFFSAEEKDKIPLLSPKELWYAPTVFTLSKQRTRRQIRAQNPLRKLCHFLVLLLLNVNTHLSFIQVGNG